MEIIKHNNKTLKDVLFDTLSKILDGSADAEMVEQICYVSEQMIKDDKNNIEIEKARMFMEIERQERLNNATESLVQIIDSVE